MDTREPDSLEVIQNDFLAKLEVIERRGRYSFRFERDRDRRDELVAELVALCWKRWLTYKKRGLPIEKFFWRWLDHRVFEIVRGTRATGRITLKDVTSERARQARGFTVWSLDGDCWKTRERDWMDSITDRRSRPRAQACGRLMYEEVVSRVPEREGSLLRALLAGFSASRWAKMNRMGSSTGLALQAHLQEVASELYPATLD